MTYGARGERKEDDRERKPLAQEVMGAEEGSPGGERKGGERKKKLGPKGEKEG